MRATVYATQEVGSPDPTVVSFGPDQHHIKFGASMDGSLSCDTSYLLALHRRIRLYLYERGESVDEGTGDAG